MLHTLAIELDSKHLMVIVMVSISALIPIIWMIASAARSVAVNREREQSRRELAAYVAEGSMTADEAERLMKASPKRGAAAAAAEAESVSC